MQFCHPKGNVPASLRSGVCFGPLPSKSPHPTSSPALPLPSTPRAEGEQVGGKAQACSLQLCPYSQHLTRGPDVHTGSSRSSSSSNNLSNASPRWERGTCRHNPTISHDGVITGLISLHLERTHLIYQIKATKTRGTIQKWYCMLSISSAHQTKATLHLAVTQLATR